MARGQGRSQRFRGDRGSALVEAAIALPFLVIMVFGIVELGFLFRSASVVTSSTRSGVRLMAAQYGSATTSGNQANVLTAVRQTVEKDLSNRASDDTPAVLWIYKADPSTGLPLNGDFSSCSAPCIQYTWTGSQFGSPSGSWAAPNVCGSNHDTVGVFVRMTHSPIGFNNFFGTLTINEHAVMALEAPNPNTCPVGS
ncbi:MAG TPA: TadE/TadG family type IV pilus assembly protein [Acidimicrobiales bacterium]|jgi:hypothetical protein|nr:TadE/TadG family type IV pilus assembly protein [Acidimicrobiales bacterium]